MKTGPRIAALYSDIIFHCSARKTIHGVAVRAFLPNDSKLLFDKIEQAIGLIKQYGPCHYRRLPFVRILVLGKVGPLGEWHRAARLIKLRENWIHDAATDPVHVAATIVHELAHAWLDEHNVGYLPTRRRRIEAICYKSQARFVRRIPGCAELADYYIDCSAAVMSQTDEEWSDRAFRARDREYLVQLGTPAWLLNIFDHLSRKRSAV